MKLGLVHFERQQRDSQGRIFLNCDPYCFEKILSFLRCKLIEHPDRPAPQPVIQQESQAEFAALAEYLGIKNFIAGATGHMIHAKVTEDFQFSKVLGMLVSEDAHAAEAAAGNNVAFAAPGMQYGMVHFIKCNIMQRSSNAWSFLGITQLSEPRKDAELDNSSFGWSTLPGAVSVCYNGNTRLLDFVLGWQAGDQAVFKVDLTERESMLFVWCTCFPLVCSVSLSNVAKVPFFFHFGAQTGRCKVKVQLAPATIQDRQLFA